MVYTIGKNVVAYEAREQDLDDLLALIYEIAVYEKMEKEVTATKETLKQSLLVDRRASVLLIAQEGQVIGYMLYFCNYSTCRGSANFYLEDLYIKQAYRHQGIGRKMFELLAQIALENGCKRIDWVCLDWNQPSLDFYRKIGAKPLKQWVVHRLEEDQITALAETNQDILYYL